jgi:hypothetical protein
MACINLEVCVCTVGWTGMLGGMIKVQATCEPRACTMTRATPFLIPGSLTKHTIGHD